MDLFSASNSYYLKAVARPLTTPVFHSEQHRQSSRGDRQNPNMEDLKPISGVFSLSEAEAILQPNEKDPQSYLDSLKAQSYADDLKHLHEVRLFRQNAELKFPKLLLSAQQFLEVYNSLQRRYDLEISNQRGLNPFIHVPNYLEGTLAMAGHFKSLRNLQRILRQVEENYMTMKVHCSLLREINGADMLDLQKSRVCLGQPSNAQIIYIKPSPDEKLETLLWSAIKLIRNSLDEGGCLIFSVVDVSSSIVDQYLFLFQKMFLNITLWQELILSTKIYIGCYGFQQALGRPLLDKVLRIPRQPSNLFEKRELVEVRQFSVELTHFFNKLAKRRTAQLRLVRVLQGSTFGGPADFEKMLQQLADEAKHKSRGYNKEFHRRDSHQTRKTLNPSTSSTQFITQITYIDHHAKRLEHMRLTGEDKRLERERIKREEEDERKRKEAEEKKIKDLLQENSKRKPRPKPKGNEGSTVSKSITKQKKR